MSGIPKSQKITINYASPGAQPPIYVADSFTDPPWQPQELEFVANESKGASLGAKEYDFFAHFDIKEGRWEYKFRLGTGDWWVCDDRIETGEPNL